MPANMYDTGCFRPMTHLLVCSRVTRGGITDDGRRAGHQHLTRPRAVLPAAQPIPSPAGQSNSSLSRPISLGPTAGRAIQPIPFHSDRPPNASSPQPSTSVAANSASTAVLPVVQGIWVGSCAWMEWGVCLCGGISWE